jgi:hypothetical protein
VRHARPATWAKLHSEPTSGLVGAMVVFVKVTLKQTHVALEEVCDRRKRGPEAPLAVPAMADLAYLRFSQHLISHSAASAVELDVCGPAASRSLQAAPHRLNDLALRIRVLDESAPPCRTGAVAMTAARRSPTGIADVDDSAVARYWQQVTP